MGSSSSAEADLPPLPQQQIVDVSQGVPDHDPRAGERIGTMVGQSMQTVAVSYPVRLLREGLSVSSSGVVSIQVDATVDSVVEAVSPALEQPAADGRWPQLTEAEAAGVRPGRWRREVRGGGRRQVTFSGADEALAAPDRQSSPQRREDDGGVRWPIAFVLRPHLGGPGPCDAPLDGTLLVCCVVVRGQMQIVKQVIAWGGGGAYVVEDLYGIQEARGAGSGQAAGGAALTTEEESQRNCVVCLTAPKDTFLRPCNHFCVCYDCGYSLRLSTRSRCPLCRGEVKDIVRLTEAERSADSGHDANAGDGAAADSGCVVLPPPDAPGEPSSPSVQVDRTVTDDDPSVEVPERPGGEAGGGEANAAPAAPLEAPAAEAAAGAPLSPAALREARLRALGGAGTAAAPPPAAPPGAARGERSAPPSSGADSAGLPPRCLKRLGMEMRHIEENREQHLREHAIELVLADPEGNDLRVWLLKLHARGIDEESALGQAMKSRSVDALELEVWIPDHFPTEPPRVRVLRPCFSSGSFFVHAGGAICLEILSKLGWSPAMTLPQLGIQIMAGMAQGSGTITSPASVGSSRAEAWQVAQRIDRVHADWNDPSAR